MIATIAKEFTFDAAHHLPMLPATHKCHRMHGHTYRVEVVLAGPVDPTTGFVVDYQDIADAWQRVHDLLDHRILNEVPGLEIPSTEVLARFIVKELVDGTDLLALLPGALPEGIRHAYLPSTLVQSVRVMESSTTWCSVVVSQCGTKRTSLINPHAYLSVE